MKKKACFLSILLLMIVMQGCKDEFEENDVVDSVKQEAVGGLN